MKIGIIGGSGLDDPRFFAEGESRVLVTPYGNPSSEIRCGKIFGVDVCILARHGEGHTITPTHVNNRANIYALKEIGCTHVIATTAVGSLREDIKPGDLVVLDQFIDFTKHRGITFHEDFENGVEHASLASPFSDFLRERIIAACSDQGYRFHERGTVVTIEGPRFSTRAESMLFRQWGADVINMSIAPEAILSREAGLDYSAIAMSTDYDCWKEGEEDVSIERVFQTMKENAEKVKQVILSVISNISCKEVSDTEREYIRSRIRTVPDFPKKGIMFRDITTLLKDSDCLNRVIDIFERRYKGDCIDVIAGIESRGFIIGSILASRLGKPFVPVRKQRKLPAETVSEEYSLEYGLDRIEVHRDSISCGQRVLIVDDLIATGGTAKAAANLVEKLGGVVRELAFVIELPDLKGREKLNRWDVFTLVDFLGE